MSCRGETQTTLTCWWDVALNCREMLPWVVKRCDSELLRGRSSGSLIGRGSELLRNAALIHLEDVALKCWEMRLWFIWRAWLWIVEGTHPWIDVRTLPWIEERRGPELFNLLDSWKDVDLSRDLELLKTQSSFCWGNAAFGLRRDADFKTRPLKRRMQFIEMRRSRWMFWGKVGVDGWGRVSLVLLGVKIHVSYPYWIWYSRSELRLLIGL